MCAVISGDHLVQLPLRIICKHRRIVCQKDRQPAGKDKRQIKQPHLPERTYPPLHLHFSLRLFFPCLFFLLFRPVRSPAQNISRTARRRYREAYNLHQKKEQIFHMKGQSAIAFKHHSLHDKPESHHKGGRNRYAPDAGVDEKSLIVFHLFYDFHRLSIP